MNKSFCEIFMLILFLGLGQSLAYSQQARINPLAVKTSNLIEDLISLKSSKPDISIEELVKNANSMLEKQGFNYSFVFDENSCQQIAQTRKNQKDPNAPLNLTAKLSSVAGEKMSLILPQERYDKSECGRCFTYLPVWEATDKDFVTFVQNINVKFYLPGNFQVNEIDLVDNTDLTKITKRWKIPFRATPISISDDGKVLYLPLPEAQLKDLVLLVYDEGVIQFYPRKDVDQNKKGILLNEFPKDVTNPSLAFIRFESGNTKQTIRFTTACNN